MLIENYKMIHIMKQNKIYKKGTYFGLEEVFPLFFYLSHTINSSIFYYLSYYGDNAIFNDFF